MSDSVTWANTVTRFEESNLSIFSPHLTSSPISSHCVQSEEWQCGPGQLYNPLLLVCQEEDQTVGASLISRIWISSSVQVTCSLTTSLASQDITQLVCTNPGLTPSQREMCEKKHWKQTDHF